MDIRPSPIAGMWYPGAAQPLRESVDRFLGGASPALGIEPAQVVGLVVPHAGHRYSGAVAAAAFRAVQGAAVERVALICPSHFHAEAPALTTGHAAYATPLGTVPVDTEGLAQLRRALAAALGLPEHDSLRPLRHDREHAIEIELPFLQRVLAPGFRLLPVMLRDQSEVMARALGAALAEVLAGSSALVIASSDLSHYFPQAMARQLDAQILRPIEVLDPAGVLRAHLEGRGQACGAGAIAATLWAAQALGADQARVVRHATSGDVSGDYDEVVGYAAAVLWRQDDE